MSEPSASHIQQLPLARPAQPSKLAADKAPARVRVPFRNQTAGLLSGSTGVPLPSCANQPSGSGSGIGLAGGGDRRRTIRRLGRKERGRSSGTVSSATEIRSPSCLEPERVSCLLDPARRACPHATPSPCLKRFMQASPRTLILWVGGVRGKGITFITCRQLGREKGAVPPFPRLCPRHYAT